MAPNNRLIIFLLLSTQFPVYSTAEDRQAVTLTYRVLSKLEFTHDNLALLGKAATRDKMGLVSIWFTTSKDDARDLFSEVFSMEGRPYKQWRNRYDENAARHWDVAWFVSWNGSAVLAMRTQSDRITRDVLWGTDFLTIDEEGVKTQIVGLALMNSDPMPDVFLLAKTNGALEPKKTLIIWDRFNQLNARLISIELRHDPWFIYNIHALIFDPFEPSSSVPTEQEAKQLPHLSCLGHPGKIAAPCSCRIGERLQKDMNACLR